MMKIVTYNVNGLRPRVAQFGSLCKFLDSLDADVICLQETKLSAREMRADLVQAKGYESFFSSTRTSDRGRTGYSGVATFCRVKSAFYSDEVALPIHAEEGFTGILKNSSGFGTRKDECSSVAEGLERFSTEKLLKVDSEGRCIITDHGHFVIFNIYGPRAASDDAERIEFKFEFFSVLQKRWESLLSQGRRIVVVGDLNIAPCAIDRCDAGPDFEKDRFRTWFRSLLTTNGGHFFDVFREKHPDRTDAFTCWPTNSGAEEFNYGTRIDHILCAGPCFHEGKDQEHTLVTCHVEDCDILEQFKRWKPGTTPRWKEGRNIKLEGSDHVPVYVSLVEIPNMQPHNTPFLSTRYCPQVFGCQQTLASMFSRKRSVEEVSASSTSSSINESFVGIERCSQVIDGVQDSCGSSSTDLIGEDVLVSSTDCSQENFKESIDDSKIDHAKSISSVVYKKKAGQQWSQLSLKSFFHKTVVKGCDSDSVCHGKKAEISSPCPDGESKMHESQKEWQAEEKMLTQEDDTSQPSEDERNNSALVEWQRIQQLMQTSIPHCKGHKEPCVSRVVKKSGPNSGRRFYVCARGEGPSSNPEANCGFFKWANPTVKSKKNR